jgi:integrase
MSTLNEILTFEHENEHDSEHDPYLKKNFSVPKIYNANGDLGKRWYVYFSFRNPKSGKLQRMKNIYGKASTYTTKEDRLSVLTAYRKSLLALLKEGFNPFEDNTTLFKSRNEPVVDVSVAKELPVKVKEEVIIEEPKMLLREGFDFALNLKAKLLNDTTRISYANRVKYFLKWLKEYHPEIKVIEELNKRIAAEFLNRMLENSSPRNRNNYRVDLSSIIQVFVDNDIIPENFIRKIPVLKAIPVRNKTYSLEEQKKIYKYLDKKDPILLLYIKFISYNFLRPIEVCRLKVGDINLKTKTLKFKAKNSPLKTKIIPQLLIDDLPDLSKMDENASLFSPNEIGGEWETTVGNKRDYFTKRFKKVVKDHFNLGTDYGLYSFRHTYITKLYRKLVEHGSPFEAKSRLMLITGHSSMTALEKYLRDIDAELPADYSELIK